MALGDADTIKLKAINLAMGLAMVVMFFDGGRRIAGPAAAAAAAWLFALSPYLPHLSTYVMVEPPFLFLVTLWFWSSIWVLEQRGWRSFAGIFLAGIALSAATLTRATFMYWLPAAIIFFGLLARFPFFGSRTAWLRLALIHLTAFILVFSYIARNAVVFDKPSVATGAGAALYFGSNPMLKGQEPPFFGLSHDEFTVVDDLSHLSIIGDERLIATARNIIADMPLSVLAKLYIEKAGALLFFSKSDLKYYGPRISRSALLTLAIIGFFLGRRHPVVWLLAGTALYQLSVHIPVLYNPRYSVTALELQLTLLAAIGLALLWQRKKDLRTMSFSAAAVLLSILGGSLHMRYSAPVLPDLEVVPHKTLQIANRSELSVEGFEADPFHSLSNSPSGKFSITWEGKIHPVNNLTILRLRIPDMRGECSKAWVRYTNQAGELREERINIRGFGPGQDFARGMFFVMSQGNGKSIQLSFECKANTQLQLSEIGLYEASLGAYYRAQVLQKLENRP
jgi:4-amino-4-deoxy-L-arabinose transferase-like glycosyltransferase